MNDKELFDTVNKIYSSKEFSEMYYGNNKQYKHRRPFFNFITGLVVCGVCLKSHSPFRSLFHFHFK